MINKFLFLWLMLWATAVTLEAQENKPKLPDCRKYPVEDSDKREFVDKDSFTLDADGDGKLDTVTSKTYAVKNKRRASDGGEPQPGETHWIAFDLKTSGGRVLKRFFKYNYGTSEVGFVVYALVLCRVNEDDKPDLLFYAGDESGDDAVILVNDRNRFKVYSRKSNVDY